MMLYESGKKYLITTDKWFIAPDGSEYKSAYGTLVAIKSDEDLGIKTPAVDLVVKKSYELLGLIETVIVVTFTVEYLLRLVLSEKRFSYIFNF